jgi:hypothetical protein
MLPHVLLCALQTAVVSGHHRVGSGLQEIRDRVAVHREKLFHCRRRVGSAP